jgi:hypothetical protein
MKRLSMPLFHFTTLPPKPATAHDQHFRNPTFVTYYSNPRTHEKKSCLLFFVLSLSRYTPSDNEVGGRGDWFKILISVCHSIPSRGSVEQKRAGGGGGADWQWMYLW